MTDPLLKKSFAFDVVMLKLVGMNPVVVHGGGPQINDMLDKTGKKGTFIQGMRVTDDETLYVVEAVLGELNQEIVGLINQAGGKAVGLNGQGWWFHPRQEDDGRKRDREGQDARYRLRRRHLQHRPDADSSSRRGGFHSGRGTDRRRRGRTGVQHQRRSRGQRARADTQGRKLVLMTNTPGVLDKGGKLLTGLTYREINALFDDGTISGGMKPKIQGALDAVQHGVKTRTSLTVASSTHCCWRFSPEG